MAKTVEMHGRDHRPGGADPIPGIGTVSALVDYEYDYINADEAITSTGWSDVATAGPSVTVPSTGIYELTYGCTLTGTPSTAFVWACSPKFGDDVTLTDDQCPFGGPSAGGGTAAASVSRTQIRELAEGEVIKLQYARAAGGATGRAQYRFIRIIRIS